MEFGDLIYILIMVVVALFSFFRANKNKARQESSIPDFETVNIPEEVFPPGMFGEERAKVLTKPPEKRITPVQRSHFTRINYEKRRQKKRTIFSGVKRQQETNIFLEDDNQLIGSYWENEQFDLQKAVIYSEILKRPEY
jgi:hypothetical protein